MYEPAPPVTEPSPPRDPPVDVRMCGRVEVAVAGEGPSVLSIHGAMGGWDQGVLLARTLGLTGFRWVCPSRPGFLGTTLDTGRTPEEQADLHAALLDALAIDRATVVAVSGGGPSALHLVLRHADRCRALVLVSTCAAPMTAAIPLSFRLMTRLVRWRWVAERMRAGVERDPAAAALRSIADPGLRARAARDPATMELLLALSASTIDRTALRIPGTENDIAMTRAPPTFELDRVSVPTLVVHGTADPLVPFAEHGRLLAERIPGAELLALVGGEHGAIFTHREECQARVRSFVQRHP